VEERCDRRSLDPVALVLEALDLDDVLLDSAKLAKLGEGAGEVLGHLGEHAALLDGLLHSRLDLVEAKEVGRVLDVIDEVVDHLREPVDVLPVEGRDVLGVEQGDDLPGQLVALVLELLHLLVVDARLRELTKALLGQARRRQQVLSRAREEVVELRRLGNEGQPHVRSGFLLGVDAIGVRGVGELAKLARDEVGGLFPDVDSVIADSLQAP
jgi:hypothetical protein